METRLNRPDSRLGLYPAPPCPLLTIFAIVMFLLSLSHYKSYKDQMYHAAISFKVFLFLMPVILIIFMRSSLTSPMSNFNVRHGWTCVMAGFSWGSAILVVALLVLVSCQSLFHLQWFPLLRSDL